MGPQLHGVLQQVGAGTLHEVHERQLVTQRKLQHTERFGDRGGGRGTGIDATVIDIEHAAHAAHETDAADHARARHAGVGVRVVDQEVGHVVELDERHAGVEQAREPLARRELAALLETCPALLRQRGGPRLVFAQPLDQRQHIAAIAGEAVRAGEDPAVENGHQRVSASVTGIMIGSSSSNWA